MNEGNATGGGAPAAVYLPGLNGIRAIAALAVLMTHITLRLGAFGLDPYIAGAFADGNPRAFDLAGFGVSMFFALSGFLITYLLVLERRSRPVDVKKFYARRVLRIWPLYYGYLAICLVTGWAFGVAYDGKMMPFYVFLCANIPIIIDRVQPLFGHYWSLGVEEQFYLGWPWVARLPEARILQIAVLLAGSFVIAKLGLHFIVPGTLVEAALHTTRMHCMLFGAIAAVLLLRGSSMLVRLACSKVAQVLAWLMFLAVAINRFHVASVMDNELVAMMTVVIILGQVTEKSPISLENRVFGFLGKISYGLYVIHPLIIFVFEKCAVWLERIPRGPRYVVVFGLITASTILLAQLSYTYFEKPFLRIKSRKFTVVQSAASAPVA